MRILHIIDSLHAATGGPSRSVTRLADEQSAQGHDVVIVANHYRELGDDILPRAARARLVPARRLPFRLGAWSPGLAGAIRKEVEKAEVVHLHGLWLRTNRLGIRTARQLGRPFLVSPRGMLETWARQHRILRKKIVWALWEKRNLSSASVLHATSQAEASSLRELVPGVPTIVVPNGIDPLENFPARETIESRFPELAGRRIVLFLSRLHPKKGVKELLEAWKRLEAQFPDWTMVLAGDDFDGWLDRYEDLAGKLDIGRRVIFTGELEGPAKFSLLGACELFVLPSYSENFGNAIGEALAAGKPVITTTATPWAALADQECGWWVPVGEVALTSALASALALPSGELLRMGQRGRKLIDRDFAWSQVADLLLQAYRQALASSDAQPYSLPA